jgi:hypothetical protein
MIKSWLKFNEELNVETYADIMNKTENYPWVKFLGDKLNKADKMKTVNSLANELFTKEFLKEFNTGLTINNGDVEWTFEGIKFNANYTNYTLIFKAGNETLLVNYNDNTGYYLTGGIEDNLDNESISLLKDMFKYMNRKK